MMGLEFQLHTAVNVAIGALFGGFIAWWVARDSLRKTSAELATMMQDTQAMMETTQVMLEQHDRGDRPLTFRDETGQHDPRVLGKNVGKGRVVLPPLQGSGEGTVGDGPS